MRMLNNEIRETLGVGRDGLVAVAIDKDKSSKLALKWAAQHHIPRGSTVKLVHVHQKSPSNTNPPPVGNYDGVTDPRPINLTMETFLPLRCFCMSRQIESEIVILEDHNVAKALIQYVHENGVGTLLLGATSKKSLTRLFKGADTASSVMRWAPDFCNVFVISKGKVVSFRSATRPVPSIPPAMEPRNLNEEEPFEMSLSREDEEELSLLESDISFVSSARPSTDSTFLSFYENLGCRLTSRDSPRPSNAAGRNFYSLHCRFKPPLDLTTFSDLQSLSDNSGRTPPDLEDMHDEMRRLRMELKQTMDMYHAACKEALTAKHRATELEKWKKREEQRLREARLAGETALAVVEREKAKCQAAIEAAEAAQKMMEVEVQKRVEADRKAMKEAEERKKVLDALGQSHIVSVLEYRSLFHIFAVLFLFYFYFSVFK